MRSFTQTIQEELLRALGMERRRPFGLGTWGIALPVITGALVGGALGLMLAPKAGILLRQDIREWMRAAREQGLRESVKDQWQRTPPAQPQGEPVEMGAISGHNGH